MLIGRALEVYYENALYKFTFDILTFDNTCVEHSNFRSLHR